MKPSFLYCLLSLFLLTALLAACTGNGNKNHLETNNRTAASPSPASSTILPAPELTSVPHPAVSETVTSTAESSPTSSDLTAENDEPITVPTVTTSDTPSTALPVTTTLPIPTTPATTTTAPVTTVPDEPPAPQVHWIVDCNEYITLRKTASTASAAITTITPGESVELISFTGQFAKVIYRGQTGYVIASYLTRPEGYGTDADLTVVKPVQNYSYGQMQADLAVLAEKFPDLLTITSIGKSEEGRDLTLCILGNPEADHKIFLQASIHGREHIVTQLAMGEIDYILHHPEMKLENDMTVRELLEKVAIHIVPMSNPDGVTISQTATPPPPFVDQYSSETAIQWKANANGVDLNANFDALWSEYQSIYQSSSPAYAGYKGTAPECAAESKALAEYLRTNDFDLTLSYHTSGSLIYWSFDYNNHREVNEQSKELATLLSEKNGYTLGTQASTSTAGLKDYAIQVLGIPSLTIEFAIGSAPAPLREYEQIWARGKETLLTSALWVIDLK